MRVLSVLESALCAQLGLKIASIFSHGVTGSTKGQNLNLKALPPEGADVVFFGPAFIPFGSNTPKLASALMRVKMGNGESIYTQKTQCFGADVSLGVCCKV